MNYGAIKLCDIANGTGVRTSLYVSGCTHCCKNCFNPETWDFDYGEPFTVDEENMIIESCGESYVNGLSLLGGEPMEKENQIVLLPFMKKFHHDLPDKTIWCYSGYTYEQLSSRNDSITYEMLKLIDVLVDGEYVDELHDITLRFKGSSNQRIIDMKQTLSQGKIVLWNDDPLFQSHAM